jgi:hypothetical protein
VKAVGDANYAKVVSSRRENQFIFDKVKKAVEMII